MAVISIARSFGGMGDETAQELAKLTGYRAIDKEYIEKRMTEAGLKPEVREKYDEKKPGFWASLSQDRDDYLHFLTTIMYEEAMKGDCILVGRGSIAIFNGVPGVLKIKLDAPIETRAKNICKRFNCDERHAEHLIKQTDHNRKGFYDYFFNIDWTDPNNYNLTINMGLETPATAASIIHALNKLVVTPQVAEASRKRLAELNLGRRLINEIIYRTHIPIHFLEAEVSGSKVTLHGVANTQGAIDSAVATAKNMAGISEVENAIQIVQEFAVMP